MTTVDQQKQRALTEGSDVMWRRLLSLEGGLTGEHQRLLQIESATTQGVLESVGAGEQTQNSGVRSQRVVLRLVTQHVNVQRVYDANLQAEYDLYKQAAQNPALAASLVAHAAELGDDVKQVVVHDLTVVQLQLEQEALVDSSLNRAAPAAGGLAGLSLPIKFAVPVGGLVVQPFGPTGFALEPPLEYGGVFYRHFHTGIDIAAPEATPIRAAADGLVTFAGRMTDQHGHLVGYGNFVVILHRDGYLTLYGHMQSITISTGQLVQQGQAIGTVGSTGWSTGPHLHFEIRHDRQLTDPLPFLETNPPA